MTKKKRRYYGCDPRTFDSFYARPLLGIDEVGTGCIAGPLCAAGVVLPKASEVWDALADMGLRDSKDMTPLTRERVFDVLAKHAVYARAVFIFPKEIDTIGQGPSLDKMFTDIIHVCRKQLEIKAVLIDGNARKGVGFPHQGIPQGDQKSLTISAASVWAKVSRDRLMKNIADEFPGYGFERHKGYDTRGHRQALEKLGVSEVHRRSTKTVKRLVTSEDRRRFTD